MYSSFKGFSNYDVMGFFDELGLKFKIERGNRCFPESDHSSDVIGTLARELRKCKVDIMLSTEVVDVTARELSENVVSENAVSGKIVSCKDVYKRQTYSSYNSSYCCIREYIYRRTCSSFN